MVRQIICFSIFLSCSTALLGKSFKEDQLLNPRVRQAYKDQEKASQTLFESKNLQWPPNQILFRAFKADRVLELWSFAKSKQQYVLVKEYEICSVSGRLGPKRKQGDGQIPEGFYTISGFNPASNFYLSLRVSYPNRSDEIRGRKGRLGGDIFVHGDCVTIGCLPMTDEMIKQIYLIAVEAKNEGQNSIPIHIFPTRLNDEALKGFGSKKDGITLWNTIMRRLGLRKAPDAELIDFWLELKPAYEFFEASQKMPIIKIESDGRYVVEVPKY